MENNNPTISVVIPVKNEAAKIKACIEGILDQSVPVHEIIVIDSGSTDGTLDILKNYSLVKLIEVSSEEFNHGLTRNLGVSKATGEYVVLTVGDAVPYDKNWIQHLLDGFDSVDVAGVCGQQVVPHDSDKNPVSWFRPQSLPGKKKFQYKNRDEFTNLSPAEKKQACGWDDVTAMYRREILLKIPFQKTSYAEDAIWAREALMAGYAIVYNTAARVYHYHLQNEDFTYKRTFTTSYYRFKYFGFVPEVPVYSLRSRLSVVKIVLLENKIKPKDKMFWLRYNFDNRNALRKATIDFRKKLKEGGDALDLYHEKICGKPPIPLKAVS